MPYQVIDGVRVWGQPDALAVQQAIRCTGVGEVAAVALMADHHKGYSQPIGGVVAYRGYVSPSGVGFDIACGNKAVRTDLLERDVTRELPRLMDAIVHRISFGIGRKNPRPVDHDLFDDPAWVDVPNLLPLRELAQAQLGTVGSGNHYVDLFVEPDTGAIWVGVHFGSRGFGHQVATGFLNLAAGRPFAAKAAGESMDQPPTVLRLATELGQDYLAAMNLAGRYSYAGRDWVVQQVLDILGAQATLAVHNHHNFAWIEAHGNEELVVVRKGATPNRPGQLSFIGGNMCDISVIARGKDASEAAASLFSTVHGAGRIMSRTQAAGKFNWRTRTRTGGQISVAQMLQAVREYGVQLRGGGTDESPFVYRKLRKVLNAHLETLEIVHLLRPIGVAMAGTDEYDPYKD